MPEFDAGTKRNPEESYEDMDVSKRSRVDFLKMRMLLVGRYCGIIVGKGGENLRRLSSEHNVQIKMPSSHTPDRIFNVDGDMDGCIGVVQKILPACSQAPYPVGPACTFEINLLVSTNSVGMLIGKGGEKLKEIRDQTHGNLKVYQECLPSSDERVVAIGGKCEEEVISALRIILSILKDARGSPMMHYNPNNQRNENIHAPMVAAGMADLRAPMMTHEIDLQHDPFLQLQTVTSITIPSEMCGTIIGKAGSRIKEIRHTSGAKLDFNRETDGEKEEDKVITITGTKQQVNIAEQLIAHYVRSRYR